MFSTKTSEAEALRKIRKFIQSPKAEMFRKCTGTVASTEYVLAVRLRKGSIFYALRSVKAS